MRYIGLDLHKQSLEVCALDGKGKRLFRMSVAVNRTALDEFARKHLRKTDRVALEATTNTWAVVEILRPFVAEVVVGNPLQIKAIAQAKVKTDKIDAEVLAQLLRCDYLPAVWHPDEHTQKLWRLATVRAGQALDPAEEPGPVPAGPTAHRAHGAGEVERGAAKGGRTTPEEAGEVRCGRGAGRGSVERDVPPLESAAGQESRAVVGR